MLDPETRHADMVKALVRIRQLVRVFADDYHAHNVGLGAYEACAEVDEVAKDALSEFSLKRYSWGSE